MLIKYYRNKYFFKLFFKLKFWLWFNISSYSCTTLT